MIRNKDTAPQLVVWVEPITRADFGGYSGRALFLGADGDRVDVMCLDGASPGQELSVPRNGVLVIP